MLTINAQCDGMNLSVFVADDDGERVFEAQGGMTLGGMEATGSMASDASDWQNRKAVRDCVAFCGDRRYWISPAIGEAFRQHDDYCLNKLAYGN
jgi:hypothetical protein